MLKRALNMEIKPMTRTAVTKKPARGRLFSIYSELT